MTLRLLRVPLRPPAEWIEDRHPARLEIRDVARHHGEPVLQRRGRDHEIGALIAESGAQGAPPPCRLQIKRQDPLAIEGQQPVQPVRELAGKAWIRRALSSNAALYFADTDSAEKKIARVLAFEPRHEPGVALPPAQFGYRDGVDQEHQNSRSRGRILRRENSPSS